MQIETSDSLLNYLSLFPLISRLLSVKNEKIYYFISFFYIIVITKLKPKTLKIKSVSTELFSKIVSQNKHKFELFGDLHSYALLSVNTLISLRSSNQSWLKLSILKVDGIENDEKTSGWKIKMPPVEKDLKQDDHYYSIQTLCVSDSVVDFVLYVTDVKLFNISRKLSEPNRYCDFVSEVQVDRCDVDYFPKIASHAVVAPVYCEDDIAGKDYEDVLSAYFTQPKLLKANEIFQVSLSTCRKDLRLRPSLCKTQTVCFKVISVTSDSNSQDYYVIKGYTSLYINPPAHSYLPRINTFYIKTRDDLPGFDLSTCPGGLLKYHVKLQKMFKPFIMCNNIGLKGMFLLSGAKGSGRKTTVRSVAASYGLHFLHINCFDFYGLNVSLLQGRFDQLFGKIRRTAPCVAYFENVEFLGREKNYIENTRLVDIFETQIKELWLRKSNLYPVIVVGSTQSKPSELVPAVARLFLQTVTFEPPSFDEAVETLKWLLKKSNMLFPSEDLFKVAEKVRGYVYADLALLVQHAVRFKNEDSDESHNRCLLPKHFEQGIETMEAAYSDSIGAARVPTVHWDDVGGLADLKEEIMLTLNLPMKHPELFSSGLKRSGIMFYGPPGTGKTLMAKAVATECNYNFLSVKGPELMNMYVGQSEKNVREVFERAREASPCIIFFDELDSLAPSRGKSGDSGGVTDRVVSQLLAEMDGLDKNNNVFVIAATNRPDLVDPALLRPGRFDKMFYVGVCNDAKSKLSVLKALTKRFSLGASVDFGKIIEHLPDQVTGADLYSVCSNAWFSAARKAVEVIENGSEVSLPLEVSAEDFLDAVEQFVPSLTLEDIEYYEKLKSNETSAT